MRWDRSATKLRLIFLDYNILIYILSFNINTNYISASTRICRRKMENICLGKKLSKFIKKWEEFARFFRELSRIFQFASSCQKQEIGKSQIYCIKHLSSIANESIFLPYIYWFYQFHVCKSWFVSKYEQFRNKKKCFQHLHENDKV